MLTQAGTFEFASTPVAHVGWHYRSQDDGGRWTMTWDGRLDNRDDMLLALGRRAATDAAIALEIFDRWGIDGLQRLVGDWSLAIRDRAGRTLHLARDYMGARPLWYCLDGRAALWSSSLAELVERSGRANALDEAFVARFMSLQFRAGVTPYEGVRAVPPGACVSITSTRDVTTRRFWTLTSGSIRYRDRRCYEEQLRCLWRESIASRLRTDDVVWAELSGGLDSSSVACMADWLIGRGDVKASGVRFVSHVTLDSPEGDERRFIAEVERKTGVTSEIVGVEAHHELTDAESAWVTPHALQGVGLAMVRRVREHGGRVVLSGRLGDAVMGCSPDNSVAVFDDLTRGAIVPALRHLREWSRATRKPVIEIASALFSGGRDRPPDTGVTLLTPRLGAMLDEGACSEDLNGVRRSKLALARMILGYAHGARLDIPHQPPGVVYTYPFAHRPLVDFMLAIPGEELSEPGTTRSLMRRGFQGLVPDRILRRTSKGYYPPAAFRAARRLAALLPSVHQLEVVQRGWIDPARLREACRTLTDGGGQTGGQIHAVLRLERWLQARRERPPTPQRKEVNDHAVLNA